MRTTAVRRQVYVLVVAGVLAGGASAGAQEPPPPPPPPPVGEPPSIPVVPVSVPAQDPVAAAQDPAQAELVMKPEDPRPIDPERRREQIIAMEGLLTSAVKSGATAAAKQMMAFEPSLMFATGPARAKGFYLDDYGVFFHVEIPPVSRTVSMLFDSLTRDALAASRDGAQPTRTAGGSVVPFDPDAAYVLAVQHKLIDAMLDYRIDLGPTEWLTVAARDAEGPMYPGQIVENAVMILRIRASDLAEYYAGRVSREDVRRRVAVSEF